MSDSDITPFEPSSTPDFGGPFFSICNHFEERLKVFTIDREEKSLRFQLFGDHANMDVAIRVSEDDHMAQFFITLPFRVSNEKMRPLAAEYLARAQYGLVVGCFETDMRDGEVRYHITHLMEDHTIGDKMIGRLFQTGMSTFDRYIPGLMQVIYGGNNPEDAIYLAELDKHVERVSDDPAPSATPKKKKSPPRAKKRSRKHAENPGQESNPDTSAPATEGEDEF